LAAFSLLPLLWVLAVLEIPVLMVAVVPYWAMLLSASRVTFVALFVAAGLYLIIVKKKRWLLILALVFGLSFFTSPQLVGRYRQLIVDQFKLTYQPSPVLAEADALKPPAVSEDRSLNIRLNVSWPKAIKAWIKNPILGTGFSSVGLASDNDYLRTLAETGSFGFIAFTAIIVRILNLWFKSKDKIVLATACALLGLLLNAAFIDIFEASKVAIIFWGIAGAVSRYAQS
jgi:O-antigen ligase